MQVIFPLNTIVDSSPFSALTPFIVNPILQNWNPIMEKHVNIRKTTYRLISTTECWLCCTTERRPYFGSLWAYWRGSRKVQL